MVEILIRGWRGRDHVGKKKCGVDEVQKDGGALCSCIWRNLSAWLSTDLVEEEDMMDIWVGAACFFSKRSPNQVEDFLVPPWRREITAPNKRSKTARRRP